MSELTQHIKMHSKIGTPAVDANGNILAHVTPRVDTLANLLLVTDAGDGEVATASDFDARVVYKGSPSVGVPYSRSDLIAGFSFSDGSIVVLSGEVDTNVEIDAASLIDDFSYVDAVANTFISGRLDSIDGGASKPFVLDLSVNLKALVPASAGTYVRLKIERNLAGSWTEWASIVLPIIPVSGMNPTYHFNSKIAMALGIFEYRLVLSTDDTTVMPGSVKVICRYLNTAGIGYVPVRV